MHLGPVLRYHLRSAGRITRGIFTYALVWCIALVEAGASEAAYLRLMLPAVGDHTLHILSPTLLELKRLNSKPPAPAPVDSWNFVDSGNVFYPPALAEFAVTVGGVPVAVTSVGFKRRPFYAPLQERDLRIENSLYLHLAAPIPVNAEVEVKNPGGALWSATDSYRATADPLRYSPAIHVNQEGYVPSFPKKAFVGYYLGNLGEMDVPGTSGFKLVDATSGLEVFSGAFRLRPDVGYLYLPAPYQKVLEADFTAFTTPGRYRLVVPGLGASVPFAIEEGIAMGFLRTYVLGLYHQRCGEANELPFTRFTHDACHLAPAEVPLTTAGNPFTWTTIAAKSADYASNPRHTARQLMSPGTQLYPFVNPGPVDVSGGHHDAGDYSKYTINSATLTHLLMFAVDAIPGAAAFDNLGLPESGDGTSDLLQIAKREADFLAKMQDADGGFYFLVYPKNREYEQDVLPDHGDAQVVWPKTTAATAAAVAALAQTASSPAFKAAFPTSAAIYLQKATLGWQFLQTAIATHGKDGSYQKLTFYGDAFMHDDELAWAACEMYLATGDVQYRQKLFEWFPNPADTNTFQWGWWRLAQSWGNAIRSYAFAARSGRLPLAQLDAAYLAKCEEQIVAAGDDALRWSDQNAYATSFPEETKRFLSGGWYFSLDQASDMASAYQIESKPRYLEALVGNMNYEGGGNPVNVTYVSGLGQKRQREIVHQYAQNDRRVLPPSGIPIGNIQTTFSYLDPYGAELAALVFPSDGADHSPYEFYDRWADSFNLTQEFICANQARGLLSLIVLATRTSTKSQPWRSGTASIVAPATVVPLGEPLAFTLATPAAADLAGARIVWEGRDQEPTFGTSYTISPQNNGAQWAEAEIAWPDGRRIYAVADYVANSPVVNWINGAVPRGGRPNVSGGDAWDWVALPTTPSGRLAHRSAIASGIHYHGFVNARATLDVSVGDTLFAWVYLDPANPPREIMLTWNDGSAEHRAYWGENLIVWGNAGPGLHYVGPLPTPGQWTRLEVPARAVGLEGSTVRAMDFVLFDGRAYWDTSGVMAAGTGAPSISTHPQPIVVNASTATTFTVVATGTPAPTYQWQRNGVAIPGATSATFTLAAAQVADAGSYSVVVTNSVQSVASDAAVLTVIPPVAFATQPVSRTVVAGESATFSVTLTGTQPFAYQWRKNGTVIPGATQASYVLSTTGPADVGSYDVVVTDATSTATSAAAVLTVHYLPVIAVGPVSTNDDPGQTVFFSVTASGNPAPTYQWRKGGVPIPNNASAIAATLSLVGIAAADAGSYDVVVSNSVGSVTSTAATLTVNVPPVIVTQPAPRTVTTGASGSFSVVATGTPAPGYQWRKNGAPISGATSATYTIPAAQPSDAGNYSVVVTNSAGSIASAAVALVVNPALAITTPPASTTVVAGSSATFSVVAVGTAPFAYQWRKGGVTISGATSASYTVDAATVTDAVNYDVVVTDASGSVTSSAAALTVHTAPAIVTQPNAAAIHVGETATLTVVATGIPAPTVQWRKNGAPLSGATSATLEIATARLEDAGSYTVVVTNEVGTKTSDAATLTVTVPLTITAQPQSQTVVAGSSVTFTTAATGTAPFAYQWRKGGVAISGATSANYTIATVAPNHAGNYDCVVTDASGNLATAVAALMVQFAPAIVTQPAAMSVNSGQPASFTVDASANPAPAYRWRKDGVAIFDNPSAATATLTLPAAVPADAGDYDVVVTNPLGNVTSETAPLVVRVAPAIAAQPQARSVVVGASVSFSVVAAGVPAPTYQWRKAGEPISGATAETFTVVAALSSDAGSYDVVVTNAVGSVTSEAAVLTVNPVLAITTQPVNRTVQTGASAAFSVVATGTVPITYQWRKNGTILAGATQSTYTIAAAATADAGNYDVVITDANGTLTSNAATLTVNVPTPPPPPIPPPPPPVSSGGGGGGGGGPSVPFPRFTNETSVEAVMNEPFSFKLTSAAAGTRFSATNLPDGFSLDATTGVITGRFTEASTYVLNIGASTAAGSISNVLTVRVNSRPVIVTHPSSALLRAGEMLVLHGSATGSPSPSYRWQKDGVDIPGAVSPALVIGNFQLADSGSYTFTAINSAGVTTSRPAVAGVISTEKVAGAGAEVGTNIVHPRGNIYDQVLLSGTSATITADPLQVTRISYIDLTDDIVQIEFSGAGSLTVSLAGASGPAAPVNYNQAVSYMKGHASIVIAGANESTNVSVFSVGRANAVNQPLFREVAYDGFADIASIAISSTNGKFGGVRTANANYFATRGFTGIYAPGIAFTGPVYVGEVSAFDDSYPMLVLGSGSDVRVAGGDLAQPNGRAVQVSGIAQLQFTAGSSSHGDTLPAQVIRGRLDQNGSDATSRLVQGPAQ